MKKFIKLAKVLLILMIPTLSGMSCSYIEKIKVTTIENNKLNVLVKNWGLKYGLENFECKEYYMEETTNVCLRTKNSSESVPKYVVYVSKVQDKTYVEISISASQQRKIDKDLPVSELIINLSKVFGKNNVNFL